MGRTLCVSGHAGGAATTINTTQYWQPGSCSVINQGTTETNAQVVLRSAGNLQKLGVRITANGVTSGTSTWTLRKNAANAANVASVGASATGWFEDVTNVDAVVAGDKIAVASTHGAATGTMTVTLIAITYAAATDSAQRLVSLTSRAVMTANQTNYFPLNAGSASFSTTEPAAKTRIRKAGTFKNAAVNVSANTVTAASTYTTRKNAAGTTLTISITASTTGFFEDTNAAHAFTVAAGDDVDHQITRGSTGTSMTIQSMQIDFVTTTATGMLVCADQGTNSFGPSTTTYCTLSGGTGLNGTESTTQLGIRDYYIFSELTWYVNTNSLTGPTILRTRINAANGNQSVSVGNSATGIFSDSTNTDIVKPGDSINTQAVSPAGGTGLNYYGIYISTQAILPQTVYVEWEES